MSKHSEAVEHLKRHTELRKQAAERERERALRQGQPEEEDAGTEAGG